MEPLRGGSLLFPDEEGNVKIKALKRQLFEEQGFSVKPHKKKELLLVFICRAHDLFFSRCQEKSLRHIPWQKRNWRCTPTWYREAATFDVKWTEDVQVSITHERCRSISFWIKTQKDRWSYMIHDHHVLIWITVQAITSLTSWCFRLLSNSLRLIFFFLSDS